MWRIFDREAVVPPEPLLFAVGLHRLHQLLIPPVRRMYFNVCSSTGKNPHVAPYSGAMFAIVARFASGMSASPGPKNSTNLFTTPCFRSISVIVSTRSVAFTPSGSLPVSRNPTTSGISM